MAKSKRQKDLERERREKQKNDHWLIIHKPWFTDYHRRRASLSHVDLEDISWWLSLVLQCRLEKISSIQHQTNRSFIIVKVDLDVDVHSRLGEYRWERFLVRPSDTEKDMTSQVFEYNYLEFGDPSENQWKEDYPEVPRRPPYQLFVRHFPDPTWCERPRVEPISWSIPIPKPANALEQSAAGTAENSVRLLSQPPVYSSANSNMAALVTNETNPLSAFRPYQSTLHQMLPGVGSSLSISGDEQKEPPPEESQFIKIRNPYGVQWSGAGPPEFSDIWNWLQLIADGAEGLYADVGRKFVIARIKGHVTLVGVLGRHLWRSFLKDYPPDAPDEVSLIVRAEKDDTRGLLEVDIPQIDEDYDAFVPEYPYPDPFMDEMEEIKDTKPKLESKDQVQKLEDGATLFLTDGLKRELRDSDEEDDRKRVKLE